MDRTGFATGYDPSLRTTAHPGSVREATTSDADLGPEERHA
jgi:hypothetical protein